MHTDKILFEQFLKGDQKALEKLIGIHKESLTLFLYRYLNDMNEAENMMIDTFAQLVVSGANFKGNSSLKTYLYTIGRNEAFRYLKKNKQHLNIDDIEDTILLDNRFADIELIDTNLCKKERNLNLYNTMSKLPPKYLEVLILLYFEDCSYKEVAQIMRQNEKQVANLAYRAKKALKELLEQENFNYDEQ